MNNEKFIYGQDATCETLSVGVEEATCEKEKINYFNNDFLINDYYSVQVKKGTGVRTDYVFKYLTIDEYLEDAKEKFENGDIRDKEKYLIGKFSDSELATELAEVKASKINAGRKRQSWMIYERNKKIFNMVETVISTLNVNDMFILSTFNKRFEDLTGIHHPGVVREKLEMLVENGKLKVEKRKITVDCKKIVRRVYIVAEW